MEAVISFLQSYGRPHQITFDRDPTLSGKRGGPGFSLTAASAMIVPGDYTLCLSAASPRQECLRGAISQNLRAGVLTDSSTQHAPGGVPGHRGVSPALQRRTSPSGANLWQGPASGGLSALAYLTRSRHLRVDPHAWLTPLDRKMYLRHVGRDGCVDLDLATYYIGPQLAGRTVLLQVIAENRQFAVWHQDQVVKLLAIKGLVGQEMALSDSLKYIQQEALAAPRRSSARGPRKVRQPPLWGEGA